MPNAAAARRRSGAAAAAPLARTRRLRSAACAHRHHRGRRVHLRLDLLPVDRLGLQVERLAPQERPRAPPWNPPPRPLFGTAAAAKVGAASDTMADCGGGGGGVCQRCEWRPLGGAGAASRDEASDHAAKVTEPGGLAPSSEPVTALRTTATGAESLPRVRPVRPSRDAAHAPFAAGRRVDGSAGAAAHDSYRVARPRRMSAACGRRCGTELAGDAPKPFARTRSPACRTRPRPPSPPMRGHALAWAGRARFGVLGAAARP